MNIQRFILMISLISMISTANECTFNVDPDPPAIPDDIQVVSSDSKIELSWQYNQESDFEGYNLYKSDESIGNITDVAPINGNQLYGDSAFVDEDVSNGNTYYYRITSVDINGNESDPSVEIKATPFSDPPTRPN